ncbi:hypothetical protein [Polaromonas sp. UC242_47]|uniref:hypothetical protein n=1 Tax=Polaromonas sp. UC242_47 TaxID=3374626 RepID=UPI0037B6CA40
MGLMDRDYMHDKDRQRPFSPPPDRFSTLSKVFIFVILLFVIYKAADWKLNQRAAGIASQKPVAPIATMPRPAEPPVPPSPQTPTYQNESDATSNTRTVTKCVVNGKTTYGDNSCAHGAVTSQVTTRADHNLMVAARPPTVTSTETTFSQEIVVTQSAPSIDNSKAQCEAIDAQIKGLDAMARQPHSGQMQDWIRGERKKLRDEQFRIPCQ